MLLLVCSCSTWAQSTAPERGLLREVYTGIAGVELIDMTSHAKYPDNPDSIDYVSDFEAPVDVMDTYGQRLSGYLLPPVSGNYVFWIASDDNGGLFLSTDSQPANVREIASVNSWTPSRQWTREPNQRSESIRLEGGQIYYVEALMKEQGGGDNLAVRWQLPDGTIEEPIPGTRLLPFGIALEAPTVGLQPVDTTVEENQTVEFQVEAGTIGPVDYQWLRNGIEISGVNSPTLKLEFVPLTYNGAQFQCRLSNSQGSVMSDPAILQVTPDQTPPSLVSAQNLDRGTIEVVFSEPIETTSAESLSNYSIEPAVQFRSATQLPGGLVVRLTTDPLTLGELYTVGATQFRDRAATPNTATGIQEVMFTAIDFVPEQIGPTFPEGEVDPTSEGLLIQGHGNGIGGTSDSFFFNHQTRTGNFDLKARVRNLKNTDPWAMAGIMARVNLNANSVYAATLATPSVSGTFFSGRTQSGSQAQEQGQFPVNYPHTWLRLQRSGNTLTGYVGYDGIHWKQLGAISASFPSTIHVGFALAAGNSTQSQALFGPLEPVNDPQPFVQSSQREPMGPASRVTGMVISEIHYHPADRTDGKDLQFIELVNTQPFFESLDGWRISGDIDFVFPPDTQIPGGGVVVVAKDPEAIRSMKSGITVFGPYDGDLSRSTGLVRLRNHIDAVFLEVEYEDRSPWPIAADGTGHSMVLARPSYGVSSWRAWEQSSLKGGSPGHWDPIVPDALDGIVLNEFLAHTELPSIDFVELYNTSRRTIDLSGAYLSDSRSENKFQFPEGTELSSGDFLVIEQDLLGFNLDSEGESLYLVNSENTRVIDAVRFGGQAEGVSTGRYPDGAPEFHALTNPTPGRANDPIYQHPIVINELMFNPISGDDNEEYVELFNYSDQDIDLSNWQFADGIRFEFPEGSMIPANGYVVIGSDPALLIAKYPALNSGNTFGPFSGVLSNRGERITLIRPQETANESQIWVTVDEIHYADGGQWGNWADRGGSSLELIDPAADNRRASNWNDSDETEKTEWVSFEHTGVMDHGRGTADELHVLLLGSGESLVDNLEVIGPSGINLVPNGGFENSTSGWVIQGNHVASTHETSEGFESNRSLRLIASGGGDNGANRVETDLSSTLSNGQTVTIRGQARWLSGHTNLLARLKGNYLEAVASLPPSRHAGTPGEPNSRLVSNAGPAIFDLKHSPILPAANEKVVVTARVEDPDGIQSVTLSYRRDPQSARTQVAMRDDGTGDDALAGDGVYTGSIPGQPSGAMVGFIVVALDDGTPMGTSQFPPGGTSEEALVRFGEPQPIGNFPTYRMWFTEEKINTWSSREKLSNEGLDGTFVLGNHRVIYNIKGRFRGSPFIRPGYGSPLSGITAYVFETPKDDELLGAREFNLDGLEQPGRDPTFQREKLSFWIGRELGIPYSHQSYIFLYVNGRQRGQVYTDSDNPSSSYVKHWFPDNQDGELFKIDDWFEFNDNVQREFNEDAQLRNYTTTGGEKKLARYRWSWEKKVNGGLNDDHSSLFALVDALNIAPAGTEAYDNAVKNLVDFEQWSRVFATRRIVADWDGYGYSRGKNQFAYLPEGGQWKMLLWDLDFSLGGGSRDPGENLFAGVNDPTMTIFYNHPTFRRAYLRAMSDALQGPLNPANIDPVMDAQFAALVANGVNAGNPSPIKSWLQQRRNTIQNALNQVDAPLSITSNNGNPFTTDESLISLTGTAPVSIRSILVNNQIHPVKWTAVNQWQLDWVLQPGENSITVQGMDSNGVTIADTSDSISIDFTGTLDEPESSLVISEIMYHAAFPGAEYLEIHNRSQNTAFDLGGMVLEGVDFQFPSGSILRSGEYGVIIRDSTAFAAAYGNEAKVLGIFNGRLDNAGETITLLIPATDAAPERRIDEVTYDRIAPWPFAADGGGPSLQLIDVMEDNNRIGNWGIGTQSGEHFEPFNLVSFDSVWSYSQTGTLPAPNWMSPDYDDASWPSGRGLLYVESSPLPGPKNTPLELGQITYYFRHTFDAAPPISKGAFIETVPQDEGTGLDGDYWNRPPASITSLAETGSTLIDTLPPDASFIARTLNYSGNDLSPISTWLGPDASTLTPPSSGNMDDGLIALSGWLAITEPGTVAFRMESDDGSILMINQTVVIDNDGSHGAPGPAPDGTFTFEKAGLYPIEIQYYNGEWTDGAGQHGGASLLLTSNGGAGIGLGDNGTIPPGRWYNAEDLQRLGISADNDTPLPAGILSLNTIVDDGFLLYLNGEEILRMGLPEGEITPTTTANRTVSNAGIEGPFSLPGDLVKPGRNVIAAEVHQTNTGSSDVVFGLQGDYIPNRFEGPYTPGAPNSNAMDLPEFPLLWLNEVNANTNALITDSQGENDPWLELVNDTSESIDISGWFLSSSAEMLTLWSFPESTVIPANGHLLVWLDGQTEQTTADERHAGFTVDFSAPGALFLSRPGPTTRPIVLDKLDYPALPENAAWGRLPDSMGSAAQFLPEPTPGQRNLPDGGNPQIVINEWQALNVSTIMDPTDGLFDDWFELYNAGSTPVSLAGYTLTDDPNQKDQFVIPPGVSISPGGYLLIWGDGDSSPDLNQAGSPLHMNFRLNQEGEFIGLYTPSGQAVDEVEFGPQTADHSQGRLPDGDTTLPIVDFTQPSPGGPNRLDITDIAPVIDASTITINTEGEFVMQWAAETGRTYAIESALAGGEIHWEQVAEVVAEDGQAVFRDQVIGQGRFYRILLLP